MITTAQIEDSIDLAEAYYLQLLAIDTASLQVGNTPINDSKIKCLNRLIRALTWDVNINFIGVTTIILYDLLLKAISTYSGASLPVDPHAYIPGSNVTITYTTPPPTEIGYSDMTLSGTRYDNPLWKGFNPFMVLDISTFLQNGVDYSLLVTGGFILNPSGSVPAIYPGQILRSLNYQPA
jgi:hypothetical protein